MMTNRSRHLAFPGLVVASILLFGGPASATTILFSSLGPNDEFNTISGISMGAHGTLGVSFTPSVTAALSMMEFPAREAGIEPDGSVIVSIWSDSFGRPGSVVDTAFASIGSQLSLVTAAFTGGALLEAGTLYWATVGETAGINSGTSGWNESSVVGGPYDLAISQDGSAPWSVGVRYSAPLAFRITGVPEPTTALLLGLGLTGLAMRRRRLN